jgi:hypothetical protein
LAVVTAELRTGLCRNRKAGKLVAIKHFHQQRFDGYRFVGTCAE